MDKELWLRLAAIGHRFARADRVLAIDRHYPERKAVARVDLLTADRSRLQREYTLPSGTVHQLQLKALTVALRFPGVRLAASLHGCPLAFNGRWDQRWQLLRRQVAVRRSGMPGCAPSSSRMELDAAPVVSTGMGQSKADQTRLEKIPFTGSRRPVRVALVTASPVHFKAELYRLLASDHRIDFTAIFLSSAGLRAADGGYGRPIVWDRDVASGYKSVFLKRADRNPIENDEPRFFRYHDWDIVPTLLTGKYDVVWLWGYNYITHLLAALTQLSRGKPVVFGDDQTTLHGRTPWKALAKRLLLPILFRNFYGHYVGTQNRLFLLRYGVRPERLFCTPYAVDNRRLRLEAERLRPMAPNLRAAFGIPEDSGPVILSVGRLIPKKQPLFLLEAFRRVVSRNKCTLLVVGTGELEQAMRNEVRAKGIPRVVFAGFMDQSELPKRPTRPLTSSFLPPSSMRPGELW